MSQKSILLLHGALGSQAQFSALKKELSASFQVHTFTFEGHGGRSSERSFSMDHFVENVLEYMNENNLDSLPVFGYSMGGYVALSLAHRSPERVRKIVTLGTKFAWNPEFSNGEVRKLNPDKIEEKVPRFAQLLEKVHSPLDWKQVVSKTAEMMIGLGNDCPLDQHYSTISIPTLITLGDLDNMSTQEESKFVAEQMPNAHFQMIPNVEHPIEKVDASVLSQIIVEFAK